MLVATAAAGVLVAHRTASRPPSTRYVVVTQDVAPGTEVSASDLGTVAAELPGDLTVVPAEQADALVGRIARVRLTAMDLLRQDDLIEADRFSDGAAIEIALDLPPAQALSGTLRAGDLVDVLSTDPDGQGTATIARAVAVTDVGGDRAGDAGIGATGTVRVRVGLPDTSTAEAVIDAAVRTELTLALPAPGRDGAGAAR